MYKIIHCKAYKSISEYWAPAEVIQKSSTLNCCVEKTMWLDSEEVFSRWIEPRIWMDLLFLFF